MEVKCPTCEKMVPWTKESEFKPFCCERCRLIDLGQWASEEHRIPGTPQDISSGGEDTRGNESDDSLH